MLFEFFLLKWTFHNTFSQEVFIAQGGHVSSKFAAGTESLRCGTSRGSTDCGRKKSHPEPHRKDLEHQLPAHAFQIL